MKPLKGVPIPVEEEIEVCKKCGGFCCKYYFYNPAESPDAMELHKFRQRKFIRYGKMESIILKDHCPYSDDTLQVCIKFNDPKYPRLCKAFPEMYRPFWNLRCKLMRMRYARRLIPRDIISFQKIKQACKPNRSVLKHF